MILPDPSHVTRCHLALYSDFRKDFELALNLCQNHERRCSWHWTKIVRFYIWEQTDSCESPRVRRHRKHLLWRTVYCPQGAVLAPLLFVIVIYCGDVQTSFLPSFADDDIVRKIMSSWDIEKKKISQISLQFFTGENCMMSNSFSGEPHGKLQTKSDPLLAWGAVSDGPASTEHNTDHNGAEKVADNDECWRQKPKPDEGAVQGTDRTATRMVFSTEFLYKTGETPALESKGEHHALLSSDHLCLRISGGV